MRLSLKLMLFAVLILAAQPVMACLECQGDGSCMWVPPPNLRCKLTMDGCTEGQLCGGRSFEEPLASQWTVASVEVTRPSQPAVRTDKAKAEVAAVRPVRSDVTR